MSCALLAMLAMLRPHLLELARVHADAVRVPTKNNRLLRANSLAARLVASLGSMSVRARVELDRFARLANRRPEACEHGH